MDPGLFPAWTIPIGLFLGAAIGSFLNVVIYRLPLGLKLGNPRHSFCPNCKHRLTGPDLIPLLSWLFLRGRCRHCKAKVPVRYFLVELITGSLFAVLWYQYLVIGEDPMKGAVLAAFGAALIAAVFTDLQWMIIPDQINAFMLVLGLAFNGWLIAQNRPEAWTAGMPSAVAGALVGFGVLWGIAFLGRLLFRKDAMGHGDIKMARGIGAVLGATLALLSFAIAVVLGAVIGIVILVVRKLKEKGTPEPEEEDDEPYEPETLGSLLMSGLGYLLLIDVIGLFIPKLYEWWFKENPYAIESVEEDVGVELTMIPFGPYLAVGALIASLAPVLLLDGVQRYMRWIVGEPG